MSYTSFVATSTTSFLTALGAGMTAGTEAASVVPVTSALARRVGNANPAHTVAVDRRTENNRCFSTTDDCTGMTFEDSSIIEFNFVDETILPEAICGLDTYPKARLQEAKITIMNRILDGSSDVQLLLLHINVREGTL